MRLPYRSFATLLLAVGVATCSDTPNAVVKTAPDGAGRPGKGRFALSPRFSPQAAAVYAQRATFAAVNFDHVRIVLTRPPNEIVIDTVITFNPSSPPTTLDLFVDVKNTGEIFDGAIQYTNNGAVVYEAKGKVQSYPPDQLAPAPQELVVVYVGPGANATRVTVAPKTSTIQAPGSVAFTATAFDASNAAIANAPIAWSVSDASIGSLSATSGSSTSLATAGKRGSVTVTATLPTSISDNATVTVTLPPAAIALVGGGGQTGKAGNSLSSPGVVRVTASDGIGVPGVSVQFAAPSGGSVGTASATTDAQGQASSSLTLGGAVGAQSFAASAAGFSVSIPATATPGDPSVLAAVSGQGQTDTVSRPLKAPFVVKVSDRFGNAVGSVTVTWAKTSGGGTLSGTSSVTGVDGTASIGYTLGAAAGAETVTATAAGLSAVTFTATAVTGPAGIAIVSGNGQTGRVNQALAASLVVKVTDVANAPVSGAVVIWSATNAAVTGGGATDAQGNASATVTLGNTIGAASITATVGTGLNAKSVTFTATVQPGTVARAVFKVAPTSVGVGAVIVPSVQVELQDAGGNRTNAVNAVSIALGANPGQATLGGTLTRNAVAGVATFDDLTLSAVGNGYTLVASSGGVANITSAPFNVTGTVSVPTIAFVDGQTLAPLPAQPPPSVTMTAGVAPTNPPSIRVVDAQGAPIANATVSYSVTRGAQTLFSGTPQTNAQGIITFATLAISPTNMQVAGNYSFVATLTGATGSPLTLPVTVVPAAPSRYIVTASTTTPAASGASTITAQLVDQFDNAISAANRTVSWTLSGAGGGSLGGGTSQTNANGQATIVYTAAAAPNGSTVTVTAIDVTTPSITGQVTLTPQVSAPTPSRLGILSQPSASTASGTPLAQQPSVQVQDANGNSIATPTPMTVTATWSSGTVQNATATTNTSGVATFTNLTLVGNGTGPIVFAATGLTSATSISVTSTIQLAAQAVAFQVQPTSTAAGSAIAPAVQVRIVDGNGTTVTSATNTVTIAIGTNPANGILSGTLSAAAVNGVATFSNLSIGSAGTGYTLTAASTNLSGATSNAFDVTASTASIAWTNPAGGSWSLASNWSLGRVPGPGDSVVIALSGTYTVNLDTTFIARSITVGGASGVQTLAHTARTLTLNNFLTVLTNGVLALNSATIVGPGLVVNQNSLTMLYSTIATSFTNQGLVIANGGSSLTGVVTTQAGSTIRLLPDGQTGFSNFTVANGFTNNGAIELTSLTSAYSANLTVTNGTLVNASGGTITSVVGASGSRQLNAALDNQGLLTINQPLTMNRGSSAIANSGTIDVTGADLSISQSGTSPSVTNTGTITIGAGRTLTVTSGTLNQNAGSIGGAGTLSLASVTANFATSFSNALTGLSLSSTTVNGPGTLTNAVGKTLTMLYSTIAAPLVNQGIIVSNGSGAINGSFTAAAGSTLRLQPDGQTGFSNLTFANGFTNSGAIELTSLTSAYSANLTVTAGTLVNASGGTITSVVGASGSRQLNAALDNQGVFTINQPLSMNRTSSAIANSGTIDVTGADLTINQSGTSPSVTNSGTITIGAGRTLTVSSGTLNQNAGSIGGAGTLSLASVTANFATNFSNALTGLALSSTTVNGPGTLTNAAGKTLTMLYSTIAATLDNQGTIVANGTTAITGSFTTATGSTVRLQPDGQTGFSNLTFANGFTNNGLIDLTTITSAYSANLTVTAGTLVNATGATITSTVGAGGSRQLNASIDNQGTITVLQPVTFNRASSTISNSGTIDASAADVTFNQSGTSPSFTNSGTLTIGTGRTLQITGGTFNQAAGSLTGAGTLNLSSVTANFTTNFTNATTFLVLSSTTVNGPGTITNAANRTLTLYYSTIGATATFINQGTVVANGTSAINGTYTSVGGSIVRLQPDGQTGFSNLTFANGFTNLGTIELTTIVSAYSATLGVTTGTLTNALGGTIASLPGTLGSRTINAVVNNQGTMTIDHPMTINNVSAAFVNDGTINLAGGNLTIAQSGTTPSVTNNGTITVGASRTLSVSGGQFTQGANATLSGAGAFSMNSGTATFNAAFALGALNLTSVTASFSSSLSSAAVAMNFNSSTLNVTGTFTNAATQTVTLHYTTVTTTGGFANQGTLVANGTSAINGPFTNTATLRLQPDGSTGFSNLTIGASFTNQGTIDLTSLVSAYSATLVMPTTATLTNASGAFITSSAGTGGSRTLQLALNNQGTVTLANPLTINGASAAHTNSGTIDATGGNFTVTQGGTTPTFTNSGTLTIGAGRTMTVTGGTFTQQAAGTLGGGGAFAMSSGVANFNSGFTLASVSLTSVNPATFVGNLSTAATSFTFSSTVVNVTGSFTNPSPQTLSMLYTTLTTTTGLINQGTIVANGTSSISGPFTNASGATLRLQPDGGTGFSNLTVNNAFTNQGTIDLTAVTSAYTTTLTMPTATTLTNTGTIISTVGTSGSRTINAQLDNQGTITVNQPLTVSAATADHLNSGTITANANLTITQSGTTPTFTNSGAIALGTNTMTVTSGTFTHQAAGSITGGTLTLSSATSTLAPNLGVTALTVNNGSATFQGSVSTAGMVVTVNGATLATTGTLTNVAGQTMTVISGALSTANGITNDGILIVEGATAVTGTLTNAASGTLRVRGSSTVGTGTLTMSSGVGLTNNGTLEMTSIGSGQAAQIFVNTGTVTNNGTFTTFVGAGGTRLINGTGTGPALDNTGSGIINLGVGGTGVLSVTGNFRSVGTINAKLNGTAAGTFDQIAVTGTATFGLAAPAGVVNVSLVAGFTPAAAATFNVLTFGSRAGSLASIVHPGAGWSSAQNATNVQITAP